MTYSIDFHRHALSIRKKEGLTYAEASTRFAIGIASLTRWNKTLAPKATRENRPRKIDLDATIRKDNIKGKNKDKDYSHEASCTV